MLEKNKPEHQVTDKHGLLSAPIAETLTQDDRTDDSGLDRDI